MADIPGSTKSFASISLCHLFRDLNIAVHELAKFHFISDMLSESNLTVSLVSQVDAFFLFDFYFA